VENRRTLPKMSFRVSKLMDYIHVYMMEL